MTKAAQSKIWTRKELENIRLKTRGLSGRAKFSWEEYERNHHYELLAWASGLEAVAKTEIDDSANYAEEELNAEGLNDWDAIIAAETELLNQKPEVREKVSKTIERGTIGARLKMMVGYKCQICEAMGKNSKTFKKKDGTY